MRTSTATLLSALLSGSSALAATPFISELYVDPPSGDGDRLQEFLEISGASNQAVGSLFLLQIENENNSFGTGDQGRVDLGFDLSGQTLGSNGRLVIASANSNPVANGRPAHVFDPASTLLQGTVDFGGYLGIPGLLTDQPNNDAVRTENSGGTYLLIDIGSGPAPVIGQDFDTNDDGVLDLPASYTVLDAVGVAAESSELDFGGLYGFTNFASGPLQPGVNVAPGSTVIDAGFEVEYLSREANSGEWFVANLTDGPNALRGGPDVPIVGAQYVISAEDTPAGDQTGNEEVSIDLAYGLSPLTPGRRTDVVLGLRGDYNQSGVLDASDIDALFAGRGDLAAGNSGFDLTPTAGVVDIDDAAVWVEQLAGTAFGDADLDGDVDTADVTVTIGAFTGDGGGSIIGWAGGSFDGDGDVDTADVTQVIGNFTGAVSGVQSLVASASVVAAGLALNPDLIYDAASGEVFIDADGAVILSFNLQSQGAFNPEFTQDELNDDTLNVSGLQDNTESAIGWVSALVAANLGYSGDTNDPAFIGAILDANLSLADLESLFTNNQWAGPNGTTGTFDLVVVPEPTSLALLGLGGVGLLRRRRNS